MKVPFVTITVRVTTLRRAEKICARIERELEADWRYRDYPSGAVEDLRDAAKALRGLLGAELPPEKGTP